MMNDRHRSCGIHRAELARCADRGERPRGAPEAHRAACPACRDEYELRRELAALLPADDPAPPPVAVREAVLSLARSGPDPAGALPRWAARWADWLARGGDALPLALGSAAGLLLVGFLWLRGAVAPFGPTAMVALMVAFTGILTCAVRGVAMGGLVRQTPSTAAVVGALAGLGGYAALTVAVPLVDAVRFCGTTFFGSLPESLGPLCTIYVVVAGLYAALPMAAAVYYAPRVLGAPERGPLFHQAVAFSVLSAPLLLLQVGDSAWLVIASAMVGLGAGAVGGGWAGRRALGWAGLAAAG